MKITLKTLSPLLSASGESTAHIDADVKYDKYGFPYIQAKTFKGLLRESALEVCEILSGEKDEKVLYKNVDELFGITGSKEYGLLSFNNFLIKEYADFEHELIKNNKALKPNLIKNCYTEIRQQTTIENGTAKDKSLRKYRLIKEGTEFETKIEIDKLSLEQENLLKKAVLNLRYMGTRRNRGFGKIQIIIENENIDIKNITSESKIHIKENDKSLAKLSFYITTLDTLLIAKILGEQNTVSTEKFIPAQNIRGLIAGLIIKNEKISNEAHKNEIFKPIILDEKIKFNNAFIKDAQPIPKAYGFDKTINESPVEIIFNNQKPLKGISGFGNFMLPQMKKTEVETTFSFHTSRIENRLEGRSTKDEGAIFYYEGISPNQTFTCEIIGNKSDLTYIKSLLEQNEGIHRMGKSKTAQYSKVKIENFNLGNIENSVNKITSPAYIVFQSPVITYNDCGMAIPNVAVLQKELENYFSDITIISIASSLEQVENYMGVWQSKIPRETAFDIGTTLKIKFNGGTAKIQELEINGLGERKNEGYGRIKIMNLPENLERNNIDADTKEDQKAFTKNPFSNNTLLWKLFDQQIKENELNNLKFKAIENASKHYKDNLPNSLISKLKEKLNKATENSWKDFIKEINGKKAYLTLDSKNLLEPISQLSVPDFPTAVFEIKKLYWLAFFKALRVKQNKHKQNDK